MGEYVGPGGVGAAGWHRVKIDAFGTIERIPGHRIRERLSPIPAYGSLFTRAEFVEHCQSGDLTRHDGSGCLATATGISEIPVNCKAPARGPRWTTHVVWFNK